MSYLSTEAGKEWREGGWSKPRLMESGAKIVRYRPEAERLKGGRRKAEGLKAEIRREMTNDQ
jgi:hypothetical protein